MTLGLGVGLAMLKLTDPDTVPDGLLGVVLSMLDPHVGVRPRSPRAARRPRAEAREEDPSARTPATGTHPGHIAMTRRLSVLFVQTDCGGGVPPAIAIARRLRERGHAVRFLAARSLESQLTREGFTYEAFQQAPDFGSARRETDQLRDWEARTPIGAVHALFNVMCGPAAAPCSRRGRKPARPHPPTWSPATSCCSAPSSAQRPATFQASASSTRWRSCRLMGCHRFLTACKPAHGLPGRWRDDIPATCARPGSAPLAPRTERRARPLPARPRLASSTTSGFAPSGC